MYSFKDLLFFKLQWIWWGRLSKWKLYYWPHDMKDTPLFYSFYSGLFEVRLFNDRWTNFIPRVQQETGVYK